MRLTPIHTGFMILAAIVVGYLLGSTSRKTTKEGFESGEVSEPRCEECGGSWPCSGCKNGRNGGSGGNTRPVCPPAPPCREPDLSKYVLKTTVPPCPTCPDMTNYMLKTECPPTPDLSRYVLRSSIPKQQPIIIDSSACKGNGGECPPCPRPRCPEVQCPPPTKCSPPAPCPRPVCPPQVVKCKAEEGVMSSVRPYLAPLSMPGFGF